MTPAEKRSAYFRRKARHPGAVVNEEVVGAEVPESVLKLARREPKRPPAFERRLHAAKLKAIVFQGGRIARHD